MAVFISLREKSRRTFVPAVNGFALFFDFTAGVSACVLTKIRRILAKELSYAQRLRLIVLVSK